MQVIVPHTSLLRDETLEAIYRETDDVELVDVSGSETAYWELLCELWARQEEFTLIEHDVVIAPGTLAALDACPRPWCSVPSTSWQASGPLLGWWDAYLQANRFRSKAIAAHPGLFTAMPPWCRAWMSIDRYSLPRLAGRIGQPHCHTDLLTDHPYDVNKPTGTRGRAVYRYYRYLADFAPEPDELEAIRLAEMFCGREDVEFLLAKKEATYAKWVLAQLGSNADTVPDELVGNFPAFID